MKRDFVLITLTLGLFALAAAARAEVTIAERPLTIPTYQVGPADPNPVFYTHEGYQGAQKHAYPYALIDDLLGVKQDKTYKALELENEFVKIQVLPELGGRLFSAVDKTNGYDIFYHQHVIKPALIGMLGAWISGGIEWCVFHHHRNTTFMPVDYTLASNPDGSKTIWFGETERRQRMKWLIGLTLRPGSSTIEATVKFFNRTPQPWPILYWANTAVSVNDQYQVFFPPSVQMATFHAKNDFTTWPIGTGRYSGYDYSGVDVSWWKNSPVHNSFFAWQLKEDFMGGYDHGRRAGVAHVGDHNVVSGCKLWEWGTGPAGQMWDKILTDADGPYAELMVGAFSDNQPDYSWIKPGEVKSFTQMWYPIRELGGIKNANKNAAVNLELKDGKATLAFNATHQAKAKAQLKAGTKVIFEEQIDIAPDKPFRKEVAVPAGTKETDLTARLTAGNVELVSYHPIKLAAVKDLPRKVEKPPQPKEIKNQEELYLTGLRVEQICNAAVDPMSYYLEGLSRDAGDTRCNIAVGTTYNKRFMYGEAEKHLRQALERLTADYTRAVSGEAWYQLGLALRGQGKLTEADDAFNRASWDYAYHTPALVQVAELASLRGNRPRALAKINEALQTDALNTRALGLKAALQRSQGQAKAGVAAARAGVAIDPLDFLTLREAGDKSLEPKMRGEVQSFLELAFDYLDAGLWADALEVLKDADATYPMVEYARGYALAQMRQKAQAAGAYAKAAALPTAYCFPFRAEEKMVLEAALKANPKDARALLYLGNLLYDAQPEAALAAWEKSGALDKQLPLTQRNLGWAYYRLKQDLPRAAAAYENAVNLNGQDPRLLMELDAIYELGNAAPEKRLAMLEKHQKTTERRNESLIRELTVRVLLGQYDRAIADLEKINFHVREGGDETHEIYADAHLLRGVAELKAGRAKEALADFQKAGEYPENLSVGKPKSDPRTPQVAYFTGRAWEALGDKAKAAACYTTAAGRTRGGGRGGEGRTESRFYQAASLEKLGQKDEAKRIFGELVTSGQRQLGEKAPADADAKPGESQTTAARQAAGHYTMGLGLAGQGDEAKAKAEFAEAVKLNRSHAWAKRMMEGI